MPIFNQPMLFEMGSFALISLAFLLGIKHSFDADHLVAVSSFLVNSKSRMKTVKLSVSWALGHAATAGVLTLILYAFKDSILQEILGKMESLVAVVLIIIAIITILYEFNLVKFHKHTHSEVIESALNRPDQSESDGNNAGPALKHEHIHIHTRIIDKIKGKSADVTYEHTHEHPDHPSKSYGIMVLIGVIQGIASNDELLLLMTLSLEITSLGVLLLGILFFTLGVMGGMIIFSLLVSLPVKQYRKKLVIRIVNLSVAAISIFYAIRILLGYEGINLVEIFL